MKNQIMDNRVLNMNSLRPIFIVLFAFSGAAGLIYEVVWVRQLTLVLGASTYAVTIILAAFMTGLGFGSWLLGRFADRLDDQKLAKCYVLLEVGIALYAVILPFILNLSQYIYIAYHRNHVSGYDVSNGIRVIIAFLVFIFPTTLMGATMPIMARYLIHSGKRVSVTVSHLYALNTLGAVFGTIIAGYFLLPAIGNNLTNLFAAAINFSVAIIFWLVHKRLCNSGTKDLHVPVVINHDCDEEPSSLQRAVVWAFAISGAAAMSYEVAWTRTLSMIMGTTTYAFTTMLATFLLGISIGSVLYGKIRKISSAPNLFVWLELLIAFSVILTIPFFLSVLL